MKNMHAAVDTLLSCLPRESHFQVLTEAAHRLTDDPTSVRVVHETGDKWVRTEFTTAKDLEIKKADKILQEFRLFLEDCEDIWITFLKPQKQKRKRKKPVKQSATHSGFSAKQGQYLAYIHHYILINGIPPAEKDMEMFFGTTPPSVHQMILRLEKAGLIRRTPGQARSIELLVVPGLIPALEKPAASYPLRS